MLLIDLLDSGLPQTFSLLKKKKMQYLFMAEQYFIVYMYHIFFIHSPVNGHLDCFHVLTIINRATMNIRVHVSFQLIVTNQLSLKCVLMQHCKSTILQKKVLMQCLQSTIKQSLTKQDMPVISISLCSHFCISFLHIQEYDLFPSLTSLQPPWASFVWFHR